MSILHRKCLQTQKIAIETIGKLQKEIEDLNKSKNLQKDENGLLPCPFCGSNASMEFETVYFMMSFLWVIKCGNKSMYNCAFYSGKCMGMDREITIDKWNKRV